MKLPKIIFKATWPIFGGVQIILLILRFFSVGPLQGLPLWQILSPSIWLAFWAFLWGLIAVYYSFKQAQREGSVRIDRANLIKYRAELSSLDDQSSREAITLREKIRQTEGRMAKRMRKRSGIK